MPFTSQITLTIGDKTYPIDPLILRRMLGCTRKTLTILAKAEGPQHPAIDKQTLTLVNNLQYNHKELI